MVLGGEQAIPAGPGIHDHRLHDKPHHQPILFVNDSLAPDLHPIVPHPSQMGVLERGYGASPSPIKQAGKPSALRSALTAVSKSFSAYHKGSAKSVSRQQGVPDTIDIQSASPHSYSAGQSGCLLQSRHASMNFDADATHLNTGDVSLLGGAEGSLSVKVPLRPTASCPVPSPVTHTRSSLMHSLSRSGMSHSPKQLATTRRRSVSAFAKHQYLQVAASKYGGVSSFLGTCTSYLLVRFYIRKGCKAA